MELLINDGFIILYENNYIYLIRVIKNEFILIQK